MRAQEIILVTSSLHNTDLRKKKYEQAELSHGKGDVVLAPRQVFTPAPSQALAYEITPIHLGFTAATAVAATPATTPSVATSATSSTATLATDPAAATSAAATSTAAAAAAATASDQRTGPSRR